MGVILCLYNVEELDLIPLPVRADRLIERNLPGGFLPGPQMHEDLIFNAAGRVSSKAYALIRVEGDDPFDQMCIRDSSK